VTPAGQQRWIYRGGALGTSSSPALSPDARTIYFAGYGWQTARRRHEQRQRALGLHARQGSACVVAAVDANGVVYVGCYDGLVYAINPDGTLKRTWATGDIVRSSPAIAGRKLYVGSNDEHLYVFDIGADSAPGWTQYRHNARRTGRANPETFAVATAPQSQTAVIGMPLTLSVVVTGDGPFTFQWSKNGTPITGATSSTYSVASASAADAGDYTVTVADPQRTITSTPASIRVRSIECRPAHQSQRSDDGRNRRPDAYGRICCRGFAGQAGSDPRHRSVACRLRRDRHAG
jgi:hypothetical protein